MNVILRWVADLLQRLLRNLDLPLLAALLALMGVGLAVLYSAGNASRQLVATQGAYFGIGLVALWLASRMPPHLLKQATPPVYALSLVPMVLVLFIGSGKYGNHWINLGVFNFQPSELAKLTLPMMMAWHLDRRPLPPGLRSVGVAFLILALPVGLILLQRDLGTAMLVLASGVFVLFLAGLSWWWFIGAATATIPAALAAWFWLLRPYQKDRILIFRNPETDPMGAGWNIMQSKIAIGAGGLTGKGWGEGTQSHLDYLPEHTTDFVFSVFSEEYGWVGVVFVLALYLLVIGRCLWIAADSRDSYSRLLAGALGLAMFWYVLVHGGMISGLLPVVGVPMPLLSRGGTSSIALLAGFGVVMALRAQRSRNR